VTSTRQSDRAALRVSVISKKGDVCKVGGKYRFHVRVEGDNNSSRPLGWSGVTINVPTIDSRDKYQATEIHMSSLGCNAPSRYGPGDEIWGFLDDGSFGRKAATCLLLESVREQWPPHEPIALEVDLIASCSRLELHVRVWSSHPNTRDGFGDPDWKATTQKDQQGISAYPLTLRFGRIRELSWSLFGTKCGACGKRTREAMLPPPEAGLGSRAIVCKACADGSAVAAEKAGTHPAGSPETPTKPGNAVPAIVCSKCGMSHFLTQSSFLMSPLQALADLGNSGWMVIQADGVSREYLAGELYTFPAKAQTDLKRQTVAAIAEALEALKKGQDLTWRCRKCDFGGNKFPVEWSGDKSGQPKEWPYPSDGYFRELSKRLVADHGAVLRVRDCGSLSAVRWQFTYKDGHEVVVGNPGWPVQTMKVDVDFFPGMVGPEGKTYAKVFFTAAGLDTSGLDIFGMPDGATYTVRSGKLLEP